MQRVDLLLVHFCFLLAAFFTKSTSNAVILPRTAAFSSAGVSLKCLKGQLNTFMSQQIKKKLLLRPNLRVSRMQVPFESPPAATESDTNFGVRLAPLSIGGFGTFFRSQQILESLIQEKQEFLETVLKPPLNDTLDKLMPQEEQLEELRKIFEDTQNTIFGSQIRPLEIKLIPLIDLRIEQQEAVEEAEEEIEDLKFLLQRAVEDYVPSGLIDMSYSGFNRTWQIEMHRNFALGPNGEAEITLSSSKDGNYEFSAAWQTKLPDQPLLVHTETVSSETSRGIVLSFATPEEGPRRLCAVAEWFGNANSDDILTRKSQLQKHLQMDKLTVADEQTMFVSTFSDPIPLRRRNELWIQLVPPEGDEWLDHAPKIATNIAAKNSTFYQLKDIPWSTPSPWAGTIGAASPPTPESSPPRSLAWTVSNTLLGGQNRLSCKLTCPDDGTALALDKSSTGEISLSWVDGTGADADTASAQDTPQEEAVGLFATASLPLRTWPIAGRDVETARRRLVEWLEREGTYRPVEPASFRVLVYGPGDSEVWMRVLETQA